MKDFRNSFVYVALLPLEIQNAPCMLPLSMAADT